MNIQAIVKAKGSDAVYTIDGTATLSAFVKKACERDVGAMLVTRGENKIVGIITERDILRQCHARADFGKVKVSDVMSTKLVTVQADEDIKTAMDYMITMKIRHLPVLKGKEIAGVITIRDLIMALRKADDRDTKLFVEYLQTSLASRTGRAV